MTVGSPDTRFDARAAIMVAALAGITTLTLVGPLGGARWERPELLFSLITVAGTASVVAATAIIAMADRRESAEIGLLGAMLMASSVLPLVHGLVTPGVLFDATEAFRASSYLTMPVAIVIGSPLLARRSAFGRWAARHWRDWTLLSLLGVFVLAALVVGFPDVIAVPGPTDWVTVGVTAGVVASLLMLSGRQIRLYRIGRRPANAVAAASLSLLAVMACAPLSAEPYDALFWWTHIAGVVGVVGACMSLAITNRLSPSAQELLGPILSRDPLVSFELGLSPIVREFVADIESKDATTREHVARTAELAMRVGEQFRLSASGLRNLGLASLLHDIGKVNVPESILRKPGALTDDEYEQMKMHPVDGEAMLAAEPSLVAVARIVRSHHERFDGCGYPDGLVGREIPLASRIIAVCDALDAMTHDSRHRTALPIEMAFAILREHAGSQWDAEVVRRVVTVASTMQVPHVFEQTGRARAVDCAPTIPADVGDLLATVDAEI